MMNQRHTLPTRGVRSSCFISSGPRIPFDAHRRSFRISRHRFAFLGFSPFPQSLSPRSTSTPPPGSGSSAGERGEMDRRGRSIAPTQSRTRVGNYELGRTIGEGSFAKVKFAKNVDTGHAFAIKILNRVQVLRHSMVEQIKREISTMKDIKHPNVIKMHEVMASKTKIYIVLEYINGGELFKKIAKNGKLNEDEARKYFQQLINAVDYCHSRGVYHRDLKPENLLLDSNGVLKISDFGLSTFSQQVQEDGLLHTACGTPNYVAPEVITDEGYNGASADVWSCGVILYVLMAGYLPFDDMNLLTLYKKIRKANFSCPSWFSAGAKKLIKRILDPNPKTRIKISEILQDDWFRKDYQPPHFAEEEDVNFDDINAAFNSLELQENLVTERREKPVSMNAFELISGSQGFSLDNLIENQSGTVKKETRFTSHCPPNEIVSKIEAAAKSLDFDVDKQNYKMKLKGQTTGRKGRLAVATEVFEVAPSLHVVQMRKVRGDTLEFNRFQQKFSTGLKDVVWH